MRYNRSRSSDESFWVSYADLMAGLLFVFILLLGAIIIKYGYMQSDLRAIKTDLDEQKRILQMSEEELAQKKRDVASVTDQLILAKQQNLDLTLMQAQLQKELDKLRVDVNASDESLKAARALLAQQADDLNLTRSHLTLSAKEIEGLKALLLDAEETRDIAKGELLASSKALSDATNTIKLKEGELALLSKTLLDKTLAHQKLVEDLDLTKRRIQNLTGIRLNVIAELKAKLGNAIDVDPNSGAIRLPSSVLFDVGSYEIKPEAKKQLRQTLEPYFEVLLGNEKIRENIDRIMIEGHTDSDGTYMHNLDLSQKRALSVMAFIYSWDEKRNPLLQKYLSAIGRSYSDLIVKNGLEDKEASRRIEIKFSVSNKKAISEIETFLKGKY
ncbi:MAG: OmpA family protein [Sulfurospirillaceae bacterium]|nr:OmpA family protein [Sulfurospirillaceae bacterium]